MTVVAVAGRRIDAVGATPRFPLENAPRVRGRLRDLFARWGATAVVAGAACGTDLLALDVAGELGLERRAVVGGDLTLYRARSVTDRPGDWGPLFDRIVDELGTNGLVRAELATPDDRGYIALSHAILDEAERVAAVAGAGHPRVLLVWDRVSRGSGDVTEAFGAEARGRGLQVDELETR